MEMSQHTYIHNHSKLAILTIFINYSINILTFYRDDVCNAEHKRSFCFRIIFFIFFEFYILISSSFSFQFTSSPNKNEVIFPSISLIGIIISEDNKASVAVLHDERLGKTIILEIGQTIFGMKLINILKNKIIIQRAGKTFQIFLGKGNLISNENELPKNSSSGSPIIKKVDLSINKKQRNYFIKKEFFRSEIEKRIEEEWLLIIKQTRIVPNFINGKIDGLKISRLPKEGILSEIGICRNDIIKKINGIVLNDINTFFGLYNKFRDENEFEISIERRGKLIRLLYILKQ